MGLERKETTQGDPRSLSAFIQFTDALNRELQEVTHYYHYCFESICKLNYNKAVYRQMLKKSLQSPHEDRACPGHCIPPEEIERVSVYIESFSTKKDIKLYKTSSSQGISIPVLSQNRVLYSQKRIWKTFEPQLGPSKSTDDEYPVDLVHRQPHLVTQPELNDLVRDLELPKSNSELLGSRLQQ
ncbi:uncharacterized protein TNIN_288711 [Trichonephila inaurata madagascariensis]|uniref:Uncharacterized protein n=1 Tax=Trichonephila inaurata madagascariensis TaxID=2747483 RepID=A0A8X6WP05_9ARAC|nr:uncharacterized protein TNIN_288711 [Trichonephila inaurata madagascariensis]